jgi:tetratricopeptide (TPR) repeat protein
MVVVLAVGGACWYRYDRPQAKAARDLNQGIALYRSGQYSAAIAMFYKATVDDPTDARAWHYVGACFAQEFVPGGDSPDNRQLGMRAIQAFEEALRVDPGNPLALGAIGAIYYQLGDFDKARDWEQKRLAIDPSNPETHYWIGVLDWVSCYKHGARLRESLGISSDLQASHPEKSRGRLEKENGPQIEEGMKELASALELQPNYADAMVYMNLMYRQKAELERDSMARAADLATADEWVEKALAVRKASLGETPAPAPADKDFDFLLIAPPPPPPPPPPPAH